MKNSICRRGHDKTVVGSFSKGRCKECIRLRNKILAPARLRRRRINRHAYLWKIKSVPCKDCGQNFPPYVMDFDHVSGIKKFSIANKVGGTWKALTEEIAKCEVVCSNCHRIRTWQRRNSEVKENVRI